MPLHKAYVTILKCCDWMFSVCVRKSNYPNGETCFLFLAQSSLPPPPLSISLSL
eukprot:c37224_g1_i1 orf=142-303(+)